MKRFLVPCLCVVDAESPELALVRARRLQLNANENSDTTGVLFTDEVLPIREIPLDPNVEGPYTYTYKVPADPALDFGLHSFRCQCQECQR